jgi:hypothetical protein
MVRAAFEGTTIGDVNFGAVGRTFRNEAIQKGIVYMNIFPYVIWEMQDQVSAGYRACVNEQHFCLRGLEISPPQGIYPVEFV